MIEEPYVLVYNKSFIVKYGMAWIREINRMRSCEAGICRVIWNV